MFQYLALGDSITVGVDAPPGMGYVDVLTHYLKHLDPYTITKKIAKKGIKSADLLSTLTTRPSLRQYFPTANLITLYIGGNDLGSAFLKVKVTKSVHPLHEAIKRFSIHFNEMVKMIRASSNATLITATVYNPFPYSSLAAQFIQLMNAHILSISKNYGVPVVDVYQDFLGREYDLIFGYKDGKLTGFIPFLQKNPIHPNEKGYKLIADSFFRVLHM